MKERIIKFNWGTKREKTFFLRTARENCQKTGAFAPNIHVYLSVGSTFMPFDTHLRNHGCVLCCCRMYEQLCGRLIVVSSHPKRGKTKRTLVECDQM